MAGKVKLDVMGADMHVSTPAELEKLKRAMTPLHIALPLLL